MHSRWDAPFEKWKKLQERFSFNCIEVPGKKKTLIDQHAHTQQTSALLPVEAASQVAQRRSFEVKRSSKYASVCFCTHMSASIHNNAQALNLLSRPYTIPARREESERKIKQNRSSNDPRAERCKSPNTQTHHTAFWYLFARSTVAESYLLRPVIKHRSCKQTCRVQKWKGEVSRRQTLFIFRQILAHTRRIK